MRLCGKVWAEDFFRKFSTHQFVYTYSRSYSNRIAPKAFNNIHSQQHSRLFHFTETTSSDRKGQNAILLSMRHDVPPPSCAFTAHFLAKRVEIRKRIRAQRLEGWARADEIRRTGDEETIIRRLSLGERDRIPPKMPSGLLSAGHAIKSRAK